MISHSWTHLSGSVLVQRAGSCYLGPAVSSSADTEADERWVGHLDKDVVHTVDVQVLHPPLLHVLQDLVVY